MKNLFSMVLIATIMTLLLSSGFVQAATVKISKTKATMEVDYQW